MNSATAKFNFLLLREQKRKIWVGGPEVSLHELIQVDAFLLASKEFNIYTGMGVCLLYLLNDSCNDNHVCLLSVHQHSHQLGDYQYCHFTLVTHSYLVGGISFMFKSLLKINYHLGKSQI